MGNALQVIRESNPAHIAALVRSGQMPVGDLSYALSRTPPEEARAVMAALPMLVQAGVMRLDVRGGTEAAMLALMSEESAATAVVIDVSLFSNLSTLDEWKMQVVEGKNDKEIKVELEVRSYDITNARGERVRIPIFVDPEAALVRLRTILRDPREGWREEVLERLGDEFVAYVVGSTRSGAIEADEAEFEDLFDRIPEDLWERVLILLDRVPVEALEADFIERHAAASHEHYTLADAGVDLVMGTAKELVDELELD